MFPRESTAISTEPGMATGDNTRGVHAMTDPLWLSVARMSVGITEHVGPGSNPVILQWARDIHAPGFADDDTAWCAVFLNRLLLACHLPMAGTGYELLRARAFMSWGHAMPIVALASGAPLHAVSMAVATLLFTQLNILNHTFVHLPFFPFRTLSKITWLHAAHHVNMSRGNYATLTMLYDWMFGTLEKPVARETP